MIRVVLGWSLIAATVVAGVARANTQRVEVRCGPAIAPVPIPCTPAQLHYNRASIFCHVA